MGSVRARRIDIQRVAAEAAALYHSDGRQHLRESTDHGCLCGALLATHQNAAHFRGNGGQNQGQCHVFGTDD